MYCEKQHLIHFYKQTFTTIPVSLYPICTEISVTQQKSIIIYEFCTKLKHLACERVSDVGLLLPVFANFLHWHVQYVL